MWAPSTAWGYVTPAERAPPAGGGGPPGVAAEAGGGGGEAAGAVRFSDDVQGDTLVVFKFRLRVTDADRVARGVPLLFWAGSANVIGLHSATGAGADSEAPAVLLIAFVHDGGAGLEWAHEAKLMATKWYDLQVAVSPVQGTVSISLDGVRVGEGRIPLSDALTFDYASEWSASDGFEMWLDDARTDEPAV